MPAPATAAAAGPELAPCSVCDRLVPAANLVVHEATCGRVRSNRGRASSQPLPRRPAAASAARQDDSELSESPQTQQPPRLERGQTTLDRWLPASPQPESEPESSQTQPLLPQLERGQTTLDRWLSSGRGAARSSRGRGGTARSSTTTTTSTAGSNAASNNSRIDGAAANDGDAASPISPTSESASDSGNDEAFGDLSSDVGNPSSSNPSHASLGTDNEGAEATNSLNSDSLGTSGSTSAISAFGNNNSSSNISNSTTENGPPDTTIAAEPPVQQRQGGAPQNNEGWVNVTYNPQFRRGREGITRVQPAPDMTIIDTLERYIRSRLPLNPLVHGGPFGTVCRVLNGVLNGALVGFTLYETGGLIVGGLLGAMAGVVVDRSRSAEDELEERQTREVADMLAADDGGIAANTVRVHRGNGYITALASDDHGRNRAIRVRYDDGPEQRRLRNQYGLGERPPEAVGDGGDANNATGTNAVNNNGNNTRQRAEIRRVREDLERSLLEILVQMSYSRDFGPGPGANVILQPEESFEELVRRFGLGRENRGASQEVIDSYPLEIVRRGGPEGSDDESEVESDDPSSEGSDDDSSGESLNTDDNEKGSSSESDDEDFKSSVRSDGSESASEMGTCGICLDDYKEGDIVKRLSCPSHPHCFHRDCIDKWLKVQACCPICKNVVGMYKAPAANS